MREARAVMAGGFPTTRWTLILSARDDPSRRRDALDALVRPRWQALYALARKRGYTREQAEDAVQSFIERLVRGDALERLEPSRGRLRAYLVTAFSRHLVNINAEACAAKRGSGARLVDFDAVEAFVAASSDPPDRCFDRVFALSVFEAALRDLKEEFSDGERTGPFEILEGLFRFGETAPYEELARARGLSVSQLKSFVHRAKRRFQRLLRDRVAETVDDPREIEAEMRAVILALGAV